VEKPMALNFAECQDMIRGVSRCQRAAVGALPPDAAALPEKSRS